jgi:hypothetical protein
VVVRPRLSVRAEHLVIEAFGRIVLEETHKERMLLLGPASSVDAGSAERERQGRRRRGD